MPRMKQKLLPQQELVTLIPLLILSPILILFLIPINGGGVCGVGWLVGEGGGGGAFAFYFYDKPHKLDLNIYLRL